MSKIWIIDAFTDKPYKGNPAAIMIVENFLDDTRCQAIAAELNLSETAFIKPIGGNYFHIRWFTPKVEVNLCGHATLAAAHVLFEERMVQKDEQIIFDSLSGKLTVTQENNYLQLNFPLQETGPALNKHDFETTLGLKTGVMNIVQASDDMIVELETEKAVREFLPHFDLLSLIEAQTIILTARGVKFDFVSRCFAPREGINEDPVTGSAHCKLAHYWGEKLGKKAMIAYQASERGGEIQIEIVNDRALLKGKAVTMMAGSWKA